MIKDRGHDFKVVQTYLEVETVVCSRCSLRYVRDLKTKIPVPAQMDDLVGHWPCEEFENLAIVAEIMES